MVVWELQYDLWVVILCVGSGIIFKSEGLNERRQNTWKMINVFLFLSWKWSRIHSNTRLQVQRELIFLKQDLKLTVNLYISCYRMDWHLTLRSNSKFQHIHKYPTSRKYIKIIIKCASKQCSYKLWSYFLYIYTLTYIYVYIYTTRPEECWTYNNVLFSELL